ncbi:hypothetical protein [Allocoleopsis franciscana]|uniref:hypothetical protein n=1 Tax=Allocoleopsis franciscana TaxID=2886352 RepID=UPI0002DBC0CC|nr:hypothetical protein [Allocoleopsis franciscana]
MESTAEYAILHYTTATRRRSLHPTDSPDWGKVLRLSRNTSQRAEGKREVRSLYDIL